MDNLNKKEFAVLGEIVLAAKVLVDDKGRIQNKDTLRTCPFCGQDGEYSGGCSNWKSGKTQIYLSCKSCGRWTLRFQNPFPSMFMDKEL